MVYNWYFFLSYSLLLIQAVDALLEHGANPSLKLNKGVGSALCAATSFAAERRRTPHGRIRLVSENITTCVSKKNSEWMRMR